jgi:hypothetical protein
MHYCCFKVQLTNFCHGPCIVQDRWVICSFALSSINTECFVPVLTVDKVSKVQFRMERTILLDTNVVNLVQSFISQPITFSVMKQKLKIYGNLKPY